MAKFYNNRVKTGRLAGSVFAIRNGETIERAYQPIVSNPSTVAQVQSRAKMKLLSQLSAIMAPVIAIARVGMVSSRNIFTKVNYGAVTYADNTASVAETAIQLTKSIVPLPSLGASISEGTVTVGLSTGLADVDRVVYAAFSKNGNELRYLESKVSAAGSASTGFGVEFNGLAGRGPILILAYGVRDNSEAARVAFGNLESPTAQDVAKIVATRVLTEADITLTETKGVIVTEQV